MSTKGQKIGYVRVSTSCQNGDRQLEKMDLDKIFTEKISGKDTNRPQLNEMISYVREGDEIYVHSLDRLGRSLLDLQNIIQKIVDKQCSITFSKENLTFSQNEDNPMDTLLLHILGSFAEFERKIIRQRQQEGITKALSKGVKFGRENKLSLSQVESLKYDLMEGKKILQLAKKYDVSRSTIYNYKKKIEEEYHNEN